MKEVCRGLEVCFGYKPEDGGENYNWSTPAGLDDAQGYKPHLLFIMT